MRLKQGPIFKEFFLFTIQPPTVLGTQKVGALIAPPPSFLPYWSVLTASLGVAAPSPRLDLAAIHTWYSVLGYRFSSVCSVRVGSSIVLCFGNF